MRPRIPGETVVEGLRPNNCKYFKSTSFGECSICKPSYDNYLIFKELVHEINPQVALPATGSIYVRGRVCKNTKGKFRHNCEDNLCKSCSFTNYFVNDPSVTKQKAKKEGAAIQFSDEFDVNFVMDSVVS